MKNNLQLNVRVIASFLIALMLFSSCRLYHLQTVTMQPKKVENQLQFYYPIFVIHSGNSYWQLNSVVVSNGKLTGFLSTLDSEADTFYKLSLIKKNFRIKKAEEIKAKQIHLFCDVLNIGDGSAVEINFSDITKIQSLHNNAGLSALATIGIGSSIFAGGFGILLIIACNCPHNYTFDGTNYHYNNTLFTGATAPNLERDDYKRLPDYRSSENNYQMMVKNELNEQQFTNLLELVAVTHPENTEVVSDQKGSMYSVTKREQAQVVTNDSGENLAETLAEPDDEAYHFTQLGSDNFSHVYAQFAVPQGSSSAKILVRAKNSQWGGLVYKSFEELMGKNYDKWVKHNRKRTPEAARKEMEEAGIPMVVSIKKNNEWIPVETIQLIGDVDFNELCIPLQIADIPQDGKVEVRVSSGFNFWELDALQMDFSAPQPMTITTLAPSSAIGSVDYTAQLKADDQQYMAHLQKGDSAVIRFEQIPVVVGQKRTLFIHSKGYYLSNEIHSGSTNWNAVMALRQTGGLSLFSKELFDMYSNWTIHE